MPATRVAPAVALLSLCAAGGLLSREVGPTGIVSAPPSAGTFHSPRAWGPTTADPDLLEFEVPVSGARAALPCMAPAMPRSAALQIE